MATLPTDPRTNGEGLDIIGAGLSGLASVVIPVRC